MITRRLNIDLSPLWSDRDGRYTLRFLDTNLQMQAILAKRIKETSPIVTVRRERGPTIEQIHLSLKLINPIIFAEAINRGRNNSHSNFGTYETHQISGYWFKELCRAIYYLDCIKKTLGRYELNHIARLTNRDWSYVEQFVDQRVGRVIGPTNTQERIPLEPIGLEDIERARRNSESNGTNNPIPVAMRAPETIDELVLGTFPINPNHQTRRTERREPLQNTYQMRYINVPTIEAIGQYQVDISPSPSPQTIYRDEAVFDPMDQEESNHNDNNEDETEEFT